MLIVAMTTLRVIYASVIDLRTDELLLDLVEGGHFRSSIIHR
jgi:hypothetical protein